jgi:hypothetical protein
MCEPTALAIGSLALNAGGSIAGASAANKQAKATKASALESLRLGVADVNARVREETAAAGQTSQQIAAAGEAGTATAQTSAAESGVAGGSVDALVMALLKQQSGAQGVVDANLSAVEAQAQRQRAGLAAEASSRIAGAPVANPVATGLGIAGAGLDFLNTLRLQRGPKAP